MSKRVAGLKFTATRYDTPHPIIDLHEVGSELIWRIKAEMLTIEQRPVTTAAEPEMRRDRLRCQCTRCGRHAKRKGGKNINHKFVCAECIHGRSS